MIDLREALYDNKSAISIAYNPVHHDRTKHAEIDLHFIKEKIEGVVSLSHMLTKFQEVDILKILPKLCPDRDSSSL